MLHYNSGSGLIDSAVLVRFVCAKPEHALCHLLWRDIRAAKRSQVHPRPEQLLKARRKLAANQRLPSLRQERQQLLVRDQLRPTRRAQPQKRHISYPK